MSGRPRNDELTPPEERLLALLVLLRADPGLGTARLAAAVMRSVRWQRALRDVMQALGNLASAVADGVFVLVGVPRGGGRRSG